MLVAVYPKTPSRKHFGNCTRRDIERLLEVFKKEESLSFDAFSKCFRDVDFVTIFMGRISGAELVEFSEKLLQIAVSYTMSFRERKPGFYVRDVSGDPVIVNDSGEHSLQERIFGLYLTYSLYYVQPGNYVSQIRVTPEQAHDLATFFEEILLPGNLYDAILAYYRMVSYGAFTIIAFEKEHNPLLHRRFDKNILDEGMLPQFEELSLLKSFANDPVLTQANLIHKRYQAAKKESGVAEISIVDVIKHSVSELYESVLEDAQHRERHASSGSGKALSSQPKFSRSSIKEKAYKTKTIHPRHRRHRAPSTQSVSTFTVESPTKDVEITQNIGAESSFSPPKNLPSPSHNRNKNLVENISGKKRAKRNRTKKLESSSGYSDIEDNVPKKVERRKKHSGGRKESTGFPKDYDGALEDADEKKVDRIFQKLREEAMES